MTKTIFAFALILGATFALSPPANAHAKHAHAKREYCRDFTQKIRINGRTELVRGWACQNHNGTWNIVGQDDYHAYKAHKTSFKKRKRNNRRTYVHKYSLDDRRGRR